jgi:hypothetical protein
MATLNVPLSCSGPPRSCATPAIDPSGVEELLPERGFSDDKQPAPGEAVLKVSDHDARGVDHVVRGGRNTETREPRGVVRAGHERIVREEDDAAAPRTQRRDRFSCAGEKRISQVDCSIQIERVPVEGTGPGRRRGHRRGTPGISPP